MTGARPPALSNEPAARLFDVRYSRFSGAREPRWRSVLALTRSSAGRALGLRRSTGAKIWPFLLLLAAYLPAIIAVGVPLLINIDESPTEILDYREILTLGVLVTVAFVTTTVPSMLTRERRDRVLSLYFSTALSPAEYLAGKLLAALLLAGLVTLGPVLVLFAGSILAADAPLKRLGDLGTDLPAVVLGGLAVALYFAALGLLAGSLTSKRVFAIGGLLALFLVTPILSGLVFSLNGARWTRTLDLATLPVQAASHVLPDVSNLGDVAPAGAAWGAYVLVVGLCAVVVALRYVRGDRT